MPDSCAYPSAAKTPESGTGMTTSASTGCSFASCAPNRFLDFGDVVAEDHGVGPREVDVLEDATRFARSGEFVDDANARHRIAAFDGDDFAGAYFANGFCVDQVEGAGLGGDHDRFPEAAQNERPESIGSRAAKTRGREQDDGVRPCDLRERIDERRFDRGAFDRAIRWTMTSVSDIVLKMAPSASSRRRMSPR